jgi:beta-glucosidase/6-phospho-beta-glucosidase/beta-galactosidase
VTKRPRLFVTVEGYAVEGGFDQTGAPSTCYLPTISLGRHEGAGSSDNLWRDYEQVLNFVPELGFDGVRVTLEWARIEPQQGRINEQALDRYGEVLRHARSLGLGVTVALIDAVWPAWLGLEAWLLPWVKPHVVEHAKRVASTFAGEVNGLVAFTQPDELVARGFLNGTAPPWRRGANEEAQFASKEIDELTASLQEDPMVGPLVVSSSTSFSLHDGPEELSSLRATADVDELYVRSLLRGSGPTRTESGLLVRRSDQWHVGASPEMLNALRS